MIPVGDHTKVVHIELSILNRIRNVRTVSAELFGKLIQNCGGLIRVDTQFVCDLKGQGLGYPALSIKNL